MTALPEVDARSGRVRLPCLPEDAKPECGGDPPSEDGAWYDVWPGDESYSADLACALDFGAVIVAPRRAEIDGVYGDAVYGYQPGEEGYDEWNAWLKGRLQKQ